MSGTGPRSQEQALTRTLAEGLGAPASEAIDHSRQRLRRWYQEAAETLWWCRFESPIGDLYLAAGQAGLQQISFAPTREQFLGDLDPRIRLVEDQTRLAEYRRQLRQYFEGARTRFSMDLDLGRLTQFQRRVLAAAAAIPVGEVRTYGQIARTLGKPKAARAVGQALGRNPLPIVLPCHRVIASDGSLGGYGGGLERKRQLLQLEGAR